VDIFSKKFALKNFETRDVSKFFQSRKSGFTLIELLVTISIFVVLTGVVLFSQNNFNNTILLGNFAYDTALTIRQAQSYGVNTRESGVETAPGAFPAYGVFFDISSLGSKTNFILFADTGNGIGGNPDLIYDNASANAASILGSVQSCPTQDPECVEKYSITGGNFIQSLCTVPIVGSNICQSTTRLDILFRRPNQDALIYTIDSNGNVITDSNGKPENSSAQIVVSSANGATSTIVVTSIGQIYVQ
jgi:prepilin-type N-terminal cleavage/methylation domain-containing protein